MSARKIQTPKGSGQNISVASRQTHLTLPPEAVSISKSGVEFQSAKPFALWTEMTLAFEFPPEGPVNCTGVVVSCTGNRHAGYHVAMLFTGISKQSQARLNQLVHV